MSIGAAVVIGASILVGTVLQRTSGMGLALIAAPVFTIVIGPVSGIFVMNATGFVSSFLIMLSLLTEVQWRRFLLMVPGICVGSAAAALTVRETSTSWLQILIGILVLLSLVTTFSITCLPVITSRFLNQIFGVLTGFISATAGVSSPTLVVYAKLSNWGQRPFAATLQPIFTTTAMAALITKTGMGTVSVSDLPPWWVALVISIPIVIGISIGRRLNHYLSLQIARRIAVAIAFVGSAVAIMGGLLTL